MKAPEPLNGLSANQRHVAGEHQNILVALNGRPRALNRVAGAELLGLLDKADAG